MPSLQVEIAACLLATALLGLLCGWMMQRSRAARRLAKTVEELEARHEERARRDVDNLEERLESLSEDLRTATAENRALRDSSRGDEQTLDSARAEAIELNRRQVEAQERLQRIVREREREIATLLTRLSGAERSDSPASSAGDAIAPLVSSTDLLDETVRIDPAQLPPPRSARTEGVDDRVIRVTNAHGGEELAFEEALESTTDVTFLEAEEATIALDEEALSLVRGRGSKA